MGKTVNLDELEILAYTSRPNSLEWGMTVWGYCDKSLAGAEITSLNFWDGAAAVLDSGDLILVSPYPGNHYVTALVVTAVDVGYGYVVVEVNNFGGVFGA